MTEPVVTRNGPRITSQNTLPLASIIALVLMLIAMWNLSEKFATKEDLSNLTKSLEAVLKAAEVLEARFSKFEAVGPRFSDRDAAAQRLELSQHADEADDALRAWVNLRFENEVPSRKTEEQVLVLKENMREMKKELRETQKMVWAWGTPAECVGRSLIP